MVIGDIFIGKIGNHINLVITSPLINASIAVSSINSFNKTSGTSFEVGIHKNDRSSLPVHQIHLEQKLDVFEFNFTFIG